MNKKNFDFPHCFSATLSCLQFIDSFYKIYYDQPEISW